MLSITEKTKQIIDGLDSKVEETINQDIRKAFYLSIEFLPGRAALNNIINLGLENNFSAQELAELDDSSSLARKKDPALGNGGLGRLASCFLDSAATLGKSVHGYGIYYKYGLFRQTIDKSAQKEIQDDWDSEHYKWAVSKPAESIEVKFADLKVLAVPRDFPITGYKDKDGNYGVSRLRLWEARAAAPFDFEVFDSGNYEDAAKNKIFAENISAVLYPRDESDDGKILRMRQEYFLAAASLADSLRNLKIKGEFPALEEIEEKIVYQLNDTHPVWAIPEFVRIATDVYGYEITAAFKTARKIFNYTNHTLMAEALECWNKQLVRKILPDIFQVLCDIRTILYSEITDNQEQFDFLAGNDLNMGKLAIFTAAKVNGVAKIHSELLKKDVFPEWDALYPGKFTNVTNGVTPRRWLKLVNPELTNLISENLGGVDFISNLSLIKNLKIDSNFCDKFSQIKEAKKQFLSQKILELHNVVVDPDFIFDIHIKRLHEYKRQLLNALSILETYYAIKDGVIKNFFPTAYFFGGKSAPGYRRAKSVIRFINEISSTINSDKDVSKFMKVVFVPNYNVSAAQILIPAADVSEQISTAGTEASGTSNMKFALNGAVTLGTLDGANIEIFGNSDNSNNYVFGATIEELKKIIPDYNPREIAAKNPRLTRVLNKLRESDEELYHSLMTDYNFKYYFSENPADYHPIFGARSDKYYVVGDFADYSEKRLKINSDYLNNYKEFRAKGAANIVGAADFSSDRSIAEYSEKIWNV